METDLTHVELEALLNVGVAAASSLVVLLQNQDLFAGFGQRGCGRQATDATADHDDIQVLGDFIGAESCTRENMDTSELCSCVTVLLHNCR